MRLRTALLALALSLLLTAAPAAVVYDFSGLSASQANKVLATVALTASEDTIDVVVGTKPVTILFLNSGAAWAISTATGALATKFPVAQSQGLTLQILKTTRFYVQTQSGTGTGYALVLQ